MSTSSSSVPNGKPTCAPCLETKKTDWKWSKGSRSSDQPPDSSTFACFGHNQLSIMISMAIEDHLREDIKVFCDKFSQSHPGLDDRIWTAHSEGGADSDFDKKMSDIKGEIEEQLTDQTKETLETLVSRLKNLEKYQEPLKSRVPMFMWVSAKMNQ